MNQEELKMFGDLLGVVMGHQEVIQTLTSRVAILEEQMLPDSHKYEALMGQTPANAKNCG